MASQSLYRKWRSQTFGAVVGQESIVLTLKNALHDNKLAHAYLFTGPRGTGKTTTARLLAKTINCLHPKDGEPCNECQQCREITAGNSFNVIEIDAASNRGIDSIRELREKVMMPPSTGKYKVYILDEAHMLTTEAFNALLKTLEEPPPHAIFVMATTDVHKMLPTVLSRCQRFDFKRFTMRQIVVHLHYVAEQEHITLERGAAELIARAAAGGMRDALSLLDQAIAYSGQEITLAQVQTMLGVADPRAIQKLIMHIAHLDSSAGLHLIHELNEAGADLRQINIQIAEYWRAMMLSKAGANISEILDNTADEIREIEQTAQLFGLEELIECSRVFAQNDLMQKNQGMPQLGLELALLTCLELHRRAQAGQSVTAVSTPTAQPRPAPIQEPPRAVAAPTRTQSPAPTEMRTPPPAPAKQAPPPVPKEVASEPPPDPDWDDLSYKDDDGVDEPLPVRHEVQASNVSVSGDFIAPPDTSAAVESTGDMPSLTIQQVKEKWEYIKKRIKTKKDGMKVAAFLNGYTIVGVEGTTDLPCVLIKANADLHYNYIQQRSEHRELIEWAMKIELGVECRVRLLPPGYSGPGITLPPPGSGTRDSGNRAANTMMTLPPQQSAYRERSLPDKPVSAPPQNIQSPVQQGRQERAVQAEPPLPTVPVSEGNLSVPLARTNIVRENTNVVSSATVKAQESSRSGETRQEFARKKAKSDPVIQKVVEMFKAEIKEVRLK